MRGLLLFALSAASGWAQPPVVARPFRLEELKVPPGFEVSIFARLSVSPRLIAFGPNGVLYAAARDAGMVIAVREHKDSVVVLRDLNGHTASHSEETIYTSR
jgi:hypothetical protein